MGGAPLLVPVCPSALSEVVRTVGNSIGAANSRVSKRRARYIVILIRSALVRDGLLTFKISYSTLPELVRGGLRWWGREQSYSDPEQQVAEEAGVAS